MTRCIESETWAANAAPVIFEVTDSGGWAVRAGFSKFLVAEGSGWSRPVGRALFETLRHNGGKYVGKTINSSWTQEERDAMRRVLDRKP